MGLLIMGLALVWIIIAQLDIDKEIFKHSIGLHSLSPVKLLYYFERTLIFGMVLLFAGLFTTISNFAGLGLVITSIIIYLKLFTVPKGPKRMNKLWVER
ncbi:hypothetical protein [Flavobacterium sp. NRK1]|uniref:hypothetical protein n=1 Tax=Flavobacterium sp. NRK1 TaxID=2954929 RepID=UPI0020923E04|nr:hypothetical protein [Flavobacterium sp. NRK1]MCO6148896.1 hypothetical protein [Flavobacterium sp. NRK1]